MAKRKPRIFCSSSSSAFGFDRQTSTICFLPIFVRFCQHDHSKFQVATEVLQEKSSWRKRRLCFTLTLNGNVWTLQSCNNYSSMTFRLVDTAI
jgi:hypothetical protein